jgi:hypothetical protein
MARTGRMTTLATKGSYDSRSSQGNPRSHDSRSSQRNPRAASHNTGLVLEISNAVHNSNSQRSHPPLHGKPQNKENRGQHDNNRGPLKGPHDIGNAPRLNYNSFNSQPQKPDKDSRNPNIIIGDKNRNSYLDDSIYT